MSFQTCNFMLIQVNWLRQSLCAQMKNVSWHTLAPSLLRLIRTSLRESVSSATTNQEKLLLIANYIRRCQTPTDAIDSICSLISKGYIDCRFGGEILRRLGAFGKSACANFVQAPHQQQLTFPIRTRPQNRGRGRGGYNSRQRGYSTRDQRSQAAPSALNLWLSYERHTASEYWILDSKENMSVSSQCFLQHC